LGRDADHARVRPPLLPRGPPRSRLQPRGADGARVGQRSRRGRALDRQPGLAPAAEARARSHGTLLPPDGLGRRLPADGPGASDTSRGGRSLVWLVTGAFLAASAVGAVLQALVVLAVVRPMEVRDTRARAELAVSAIATAYAAAPTPPAGAD